jgi:NAD+ synthetase
MDPGTQDAPLSIGLVQFKPLKADVAANLGRIQDLVQGNGGQQDLLVFPEAAVSGYFLEGGVAEVALSARELAAGLGESDADSPDVVIGFYERWRRRLYNSVAYFTPGDGGWSPVNVHRKMFLPTYGVFQEARFVEAGTDLRAFDTRLGRVGLLVCEEMWHSLPPTVLALDGAELIVCVSASPARDFRAGGRPRSVERWEGLARSVAEEHGVFVAVSQLVGSEGGKLFPGCSMVYGPDGRELVRGPFLDEGMATVSLEGGQLDRARGGSPLLADLEQMLPHLQEALARTRRGRPPGTEEARDGRDVGLRGLRADRQPGCVPKPGDTSFLELDWGSVEEVLLAFIREEVTRRRGFEHLVLGASGGVDSSVALYLAARALGPENVVAFRLPYASSSQESLDHAQMVIEATGVRSQTIEITPAVDAYVEAYEPDITPLRRGNLAARFRAVTLFDQSAKLGALPLGTGNKSERLLGYFTWHADDSPPINPLGDLLKTQVWGLARHLGVPDVIVEKPASADLVRGVHDEDELGISYHLADPLLHWFLEGHGPDELVGHGFDEARVRLVWRRLSSTHWKRELPTVAMLTSSAIGEFYLRPVDY